MTPLPKKKMSRTRSLKRKGQIKVNVPSLVPCPNCKKMKLSHTVCPSCGFYKGHAVLNLKSNTKTKVVKE